MPALSIQYSFKLNIARPDENKFHEHRLRLSHTTTEPLERTYTKVLALAHNFDPELVLSSGSDHLEPAIFKRDLIGDITTWIDIGCPSLKKLSKPVRSHQNPTVKLYFYRENHSAEFRREFHGFRKDYLRSVECFQFDPNFLTALTTQEERNSEWNITFLDNALYIEANGQSFESLMEKIDLVNVVSSQ